MDGQAGSSRAVYGASPMKKNKKGKVCVILLLIIYMIYIQ